MSAHETVARTMDNMYINRFIIVIAGSTGNLFFRNFGSRKFRLKLTDYK